MSVLISLRTSTDLPSRSTCLSPCRCSVSRQLVRWAVNSVCTASNFPTTSVYALMIRLKGIAITPKNALTKTAETSSWRNVVSNPANIVVLQRLPDLYYTYPSSDGVDVQVGQPDSASGTTVHRTIGRRARWCRRPACPCRTRCRT